jgi:hypothetical protein
MHLMVRQRMIGSPFSEKIVEEKGYMDHEARAGRRSRKAAARKTVMP